MARPYTTISNLSKEQLKYINDEKNRSVDLSLLEMQVIQKLRSVVYGNIVVEVQNTVPTKINVTESSFVTPENFS